MPKTTGGIKIGQPVLQPIMSWVIFFGLAVNRTDTDRIWIAVNNV